MQNWSGHPYPTYRGEALHHEWRRIKEPGSPTIGDVIAFRASVVELLTQAQFGSRIDSIVGALPAEGRADLRKRKNVLTFVQKVAKRVDADLMSTYDWLCDAVHPSFGFGTTFVATQGLHETGFIMGADLPSKPHTAETQIPKINPDVAWAVVEAVAVSAEQLIPAMSRLRWVADDLRLTSGSAFASSDSLLGALDKPNAHDDCPCGSGRTFESCVHSWGSEAETPHD